MPKKSIAESLEPFSPILIDETVMALPVELLGGKAYSLSILKKHHLNVPHAVLLTTDLCIYFQKHQKLPPHFDNHLRQSIAILEQETRRKFSDPENPLLISVRSGAAVSMPGIMETVLNIGLTQQHCSKFEKQYKNLVMHYAEIIHDIYLFSTEDDTIDDIIQEYQDETGEPFEQDPFKQLKNAVIAVLKSANSGRVKRYCTIQELDFPLPTAIILQEMVLGDIVKKNEICYDGTGIVISRNPNNGHKGMVGEFIPHASGSDLVSGKVTPLPIATYSQKLQEHYYALEQATNMLEIYYKKPVEVEFTISNNILYFLQVRPIHISDIATIETAMSFIDDKVLTENQALATISPNMVERFLHAQIIPTDNILPCGHGIAASPGVATGHLVFTAEDAILYAGKEKKVILMRYDTSPRDVHGMFAANGIITARGGMTSHAAVSARGMGRPCVTGVSELKIDNDNQKCFFKNHSFSKDDIISVDGTTGYIYAGTVPVFMPEPTEAFSKLNQLSQKKARMQVRVNADSLEELRIANKFGHDGIGLYRSEATFLKGNSQLIIQRIILNHFLNNKEKIDVNPLFDEQIHHFTQLFSVINEQKITVRLLDPPLQDIFAKNPQEISALAKKLNIDTEKLTNIIAQMTENNPSIGWRGCRLGILYPDIYRIQTEALLRAIATHYQQTQNIINLEIMVPFVSFVAEFLVIKEHIIAVYEKLKQEFPFLQFPKIGIMIELPRAALCAGALALQADFLSFGTNDLTQTVLGISRDDASHFMLDYLKRGLVPFDPFISMDLEGVGVLIRTAVIEARNSNPNIIIGLCGEHGADPNCVRFCENIGIDYLSCSPYRIAGARLAAAQAIII